MGEQSGNEDFDGADLCWGESQLDMDDRSDDDDWDSGTVSQAHIPPLPPPCSNEIRALPTPPTTINDVDNALELHIAIPSPLMNTSAMTGPSPYLLTPFGTPGMVDTPLTRADL